MNQEVDLHSLFLVTGWALMVAGCIALLGSAYYRWLAKNASESKATLRLAFIGFAFGAIFLAMIGFPPAAAKLILVVSILFGVPLCLQSVFGSSNKKE